MYGIYWTNAPADYDYTSYVRDTGHSVTTRQVWRLVVVTDVPRFGDYQLPRYNSGMYCAISANDVKICGDFDLPLMLNQS
jgi:hypothetical protein